MFKDNKKLVAESIFIKEALKLNLSLNEFLLLLYFDNSYDVVFDIKVVAKTLNMKEEDVLNDPRKNLSTMLSGQMVTVKPDILLQDDQEIELLDTKLRCFLVPGHTKGGMCYYFAENGILFSGDTLFARSIGRSDFPTGDGIKLVKSIKEKLMTLPDETIVYPGHNERTTIGKERNANPFIQ